MTELAIATVGIEDKDVTVLKSVLPLVTRMKGLTWRLVDTPEAANVAFLGHLPPEQVAALVAQYGGRLMLIYCCSRGEEAPPGVRVLAHCPPRPNEIADVLGEAAQFADAAAATAVVAERLAVESAAAARAALKHFDYVHSVPGAIHAMLPRLLIDQPLALTGPGLPPLLIDVHNGVRTAHGDAGWFSRPDYWRADMAACKLSTTVDSTLKTECRRYPPRPIHALRFWGVMSASRGAPLPDIARAAEIGLKKMPDFKILPHLEWQPRLAESLVGKMSTPERMASAAGRPIEEIYDFLNGASELGLLKIA